MKPYFLSYAAAARMLSLRRKQSDTPGYGFQFNGLWDDARRSPAAYSR
ncbi:hypothetical protein BN133_2929 [Cronobacter dublinensis 582]|jgi:hypothetical protein|nr:hypothetical protein BN133_2929 [Cronobacter dublinensis 582]